MCLGNVSNQGLVLYSINNETVDRFAASFSRYTSGERFLYNAFFLVDFEGSPTSAMRQAAGAFGVDE